MDVDKPITPAPPTPPPEPDTTPLATTTTRTTLEPAHHHVYIFKRLRRDYPAPSARRIWIITIGMCTSMILCGWNDGSVGPLIPRLQEYYGINYLIMSLLFIMMFVGSLIAGLTNVWLTDRLGFGLVTPLGALGTVICYLFAGTGGPYPLFLIGYVFNGFGLGLQDAQVNNVVSRLPGAGSKMSIVQACFSVGGTIAPFISTAFAQHVHQVYRYFFVAMGIGIMTIVIMLLAFQGKTEEQIVSKLEIEGEEREGEVVEMQTEGEKDLVVAPTEAILPPVLQTSGAKMKRIFSSPAAWTLMSFAFLYVGIEVALSGWLTTFLIKERGGTAAAGYAVTGFWGGMTVGRIVLIPVTKKLGYQVSIYTYELEHCLADSGAAIALGLELVIWFVDSLVGNGVAYAFVGFFLGPIYPNALMVASEVLDDDLRGGVMGLMGSMGGAGAAAIPFMTGGISDKFGIWTIQPIAVAMISAFTLLWTLVPRRKTSAKFRS